MKRYRCPVCKKSLTRKEHERVFKIHKAAQARLRAEEANLKQERILLKKRLVEAKRTVRHKEQARANKLTAGLQEQVKILKDRLRQARRGVTPQTEGLEFEDKLVARLKREFPSDEVRHEGKRGDVLHFVKLERKTLGVIVYECKRTPRISTDHVSQTQRAKQARHADFALLVTTGRKKGFSGLSGERGVLIVSPLGVIPLVDLIRRHLIEMARARVTKDRRAVVAQAVMNYLVSSTFKNPLENLIHTAERLKGMVKQEAKDHLRIWKERWGHYETIQWNSKDVQQNVSSVLAGKKPAATPLIKEVLPKLLMAPR
jgi:hypothetical protein